MCYGEQVWRASWREYGYEVVSEATQGHRYFNYVGKEYFELRKEHDKLERQE